MSLWFKWSDWRKKRRDRSDVEEAESLNDGSEADSDYEKSIAKGRRSINKKGSRDGGDYDVVRSPETELMGDSTHRFSV